MLYDTVIAMPLTFIMSFPEDHIKNQLTELEKALEGHAKSILEGEKSVVKPAFKTELVHFVGKAEHFAARLFGLELHATKDCIKCGLCVKECPSKNISEKPSGLPKFGFKCLMCMRCIYRCPKQAIRPRFSRFIPIKGGYNLKDYL